MFGQLVGLTEQGVRATATAQILRRQRVRMRQALGGCRPVERRHPAPPAAVWDQSSHYSLVTDGDPDPDDGRRVGTHTCRPSVDDAGNFVSGTGFGATDDSRRPGGLWLPVHPENGQPGRRQHAWHQVARLGHDRSLAERRSWRWSVSEVLANISNCTDAIVAIADPDDPCDEPSSVEPELKTGK